jgi:hypothetical protein
LFAYIPTFHFGPFFASLESLFVLGFLFQGWLMLLADLHKNWWTKHLGLQTGPPWMAWW